ncbi:MAG: ATP-binding protein [Bacteroidales bacterium]|jgi:anti-sigma regulatory factor (Ser/Thr protein kinase)|nr:ATP-binding protein [Bacteroidales bacterium]HOI32348.1 ATP-binding protein [Bacteroidales bacterium]
MDKRAKTESLELRNDMQELENISSFLVGLADSWSLPMALILSLNLVLEEAFSNIVSYAFDDTEVHYIKILFSLVDKKLIMCIEDDGKPWDLTLAEDPDFDLPLEERAVGGLGILLIRKTMNEIAYERNAGKNILRLTKYLE